MNRYVAGSSVADACSWTAYGYDTNAVDPYYWQYLQGRVSVASYPTRGGSYAMMTKMYSYPAAGLMTKKKRRWGRANSERQEEYLDNETTASYSNEGQMATQGALKYVYDTMGRPKGMTWTTLDGDNNPQTYDLVKDVLYGPAGEMTQMKVVMMGQMSSIEAGHFMTETRTYHARLQMTRQTVVGLFNSTQMDLEYRYAGTANDRKLTQEKDWMTGEEVTYQYDALRRLIAPATTRPELGLSCGYDRCGKRTSQAVTNGAAPTSYLNYDGNNRIVGAGFGYDANGKMTQMPGVTGTMTYDVLNRLKGAAGETYGYGADNRRVWRKPAGRRGVGDVLGSGWAPGGGDLVWGDAGWDGRLEDGVHGQGRECEAEGGAVELVELGEARVLSVWGGEDGVGGDRAKFGTYVRGAATGLD